MTREDIKTITDIVHKTIYGFFDICGDDEETPITDKDKLLLSINKAICSNIRALEQKPCGDAIDRSKAIYIASGYCHFSNIPKELAKLPPVTPQAMWIPCNERLPEEDGQYLITVKYKPEADYENIYAENGEWIDGRWDTFCFGHCGKVEGIVAWMPLPEPYKPDCEPQESDHKCHTCKHYTKGEYDGSCGSYICKGYSDWESEE